MMKLILLFTAVMAFSLQNVFSQNFKIQMPVTYNKIPTAEEIPGKEGSPYLTDKWLPGTLLMLNGNKIEGFNYRYYVYRHEMHFQKENTTYAITAPDSIKELWMDQRLFVYLTFENKSAQEKDFFEVLVNGKAKLLVRYVVEIIAANYNEALNVGNKNAQIMIKETYYLQKNQEKPFRIDKKGNNVVQALVDRTDDVKKFANKEDISYKKKEDLVRLVNYYNQL